MKRWVKITNKTTGETIYITSILSSPNTLYKPSKEFLKGLQYAEEK